MGNGRDVDHLITGEVDQSRCPEMKHIFSDGELVEVPEGLDSCVQCSKH